MTRMQETVTILEKVIGVLTLYVRRGVNLLNPQGASSGFAFQLQFKAQDLIIFQSH